jgi:hypothetical protein
MSCLAVPRDFYNPHATQRRLFPHVEITHSPKDANGYAIDEAEAAIKENIRYLHKHILGEYLEPGDPEIDRTYEVFVNAWDAGQAAMDLPEEDPNRVGEQIEWVCQVRSADWWQSGYEGDELPEEERLASDPDYTIRSWMAVTSYLLSDYAFLHE